MRNQNQAPDAAPREERERTSPGARRDGGDGPGWIDLTSDDQPDLVAPSGIDERDPGTADEQPMAGGTVNLDDHDMVHPRGEVTGAGGTAQARGGDSAPLGPSGAGLSDRNGPSDRGDGQQ